MNIIFLHGLESSGQGFKGRFFKNQFSEILTPDFSGSLKQRMEQLYPILYKGKNWILIGSSFGGLMAALYTCQYQEKVKKLVLLAPLLAVPELNPDLYEPVSTQVIMYHGKRDSVIPYKSSLKRAKLLFKNLEVNLVDDDHFLHPTVENMAWKVVFDYS